MIDLSLSKVNVVGLLVEFISPPQFPKTHPSFASALNEIDVPLSAILSLGVDMTEPASGGSTVTEISKVGVLLVLQDNSRIRLTDKS